MTDLHNSYRTFTGRHPLNITVKHRDGTTSVEEYNIVFVEHPGGNYTCYREFTDIDRTDSVDIPRSYIEDSLKSGDLVEIIYPKSRLETDANIRMGKTDLAWVYKQIEDLEKRIEHTAANAINCIKDEVSTLKKDLYNIISYQDN